MALVSLRLPEDLSNRLVNLTEKTGRTKTFYMREALHAYLEDLEDLYLAEKELIDIKAGKSETVPFEKVMKEYGLET
jgi:RHH-type rel operon transcriptional repressor/antitoxin RelB